MNRYNLGLFQRYVILNMIHAFGPISRTRLANMSGFRLATVGEIAKALIGEGLVQETGFAAAGFFAARFCAGFSSGNRIWFRKNIPFPYFARRMRAPSRTAGSM